MAARWPFPNTEAMLAEADAIWWSLGEDDWLEAFGAHPKIGERTASAWSQQEQSGTASSTSDQLAELDLLNREYENRFGYIFIICATGRTTAQMLVALKERLNNSPGVEIRVAAEQQRQITHLRLLRLH
jgi:OHCU decarboxylase